MQNTMKFQKVDLFFLATYKCSVQLGKKKKEIGLRTLSMNHSSMHDSGHNTVVKVIHFQSDALEEREVWRVNR